MLAISAVYWFLVRPELIAKNCYYQPQKLVANEIKSNYLPNRKEDCHNILTENLKTSCIQQVPAEVSKMESRFDADVGEAIEYYATQSQKDYIQDSYYRCLRSKGIHR